MMFAGIAALFLIASSGQDAAIGQAPAFPPRFEQFLAASLKLTPAERSTLHAGRPVSRLLPSDASKEVATFGAVWINATVQQYIALLRDIENFEVGAGFLVTRRISDRPRLQDFDDLTLPDEDVADLRSCRVGDCDLKLSEAAIARARSTIDWSKPTFKRDAEIFARELAFEYATNYLDGGNDTLPVFRDSSRPTVVASEIRTMADRIPGLAQYPEMKAYLLGYPRVALADSSSFLYWQEIQFGLKRTIRINHLVAQERPDLTLVANKQLFASHYFWTALELRLLVPDPSRGGFWFVNVNWTLTDGLSGFLGRLIRGRVHREARQGTENVIRNVKIRLERR